VTIRQWVAANNGEFAGGTWPFVNWIASLDDEGLSRTVAPLDRADVCGAAWGIAAQRLPHGSDFTHDQGDKMTRSPDAPEVALAFVVQSRKLLTDGYLPRIEKAVEGLSGENIWWRAIPQSNSIGKPPRNRTENPQIKRAKGQCPPVIARSFPLRKLRFGRPPKHANSVGVRPFGRQNGRQDFGGRNHRGGMQLV
jgi:hypothetical protein